MTTPTTPPTPPATPATATTPPTDPATDPPTDPATDPPTDPATDPPADDPAPTDPPDGETFPRAYVDKLRTESGAYRKRAQAAETRTGELAAALWRAQVTASDRLADPDDLPMPEDTDPLDADALDAAVTDLLDRKPHLAARRARGDIGAHERHNGTDTSLAAILRANT